MAQVLRGDGVDDFLVHVPSDLAVSVENTVVCQPLVDAIEAVKEVAHVHQPACETQSAAGYLR